MLKILVPLDGSATSERALPHALALAEAFAVEITLLRVVTRSEYHSDEAFNQLDWQLLHQRVQTYLEEMQARFTSAELPLSIRLEDGRAADTIARVATEIEADLLVMGSHGAGQALDFPRGSVAAKILSQFAGSVLLVQADRGSADAALHYERLYVPIDGSPQSECCIRFATLLAQAHNAELRVVYYVNPVELPIGVPQTSESLTLVRRLSQLAVNAAQRKTDQIRAQLPHNLDADISIRVCPDPFASVACEAADESASLVIAPPHLLQTDGAGAETNAGRWKPFADLPLLFLNPMVTSTEFAAPAHATTHSAADSAAAETAGMVDTV